MESGLSHRRQAREWGIVYVARPGEDAEEGVIPAPRSATPAE